MKILRYLNIFKSSLFKNIPVEFTFFITSRCNFRCHHCFFWKELENKEKNELTILEIEKLVKKLPKLLRLIITGGEPFIRKDIVQICQLFYKYTKPLHVTIPTNGFFSDKIILETEAILKSCPKTFFNVSLSLDELWEARDKMVEEKDSFKTLIETNKRLQMLKSKYYNLGVTVIAVQTAENEDKLNEIFNFAMEEMKVDNFGFGPVRVGPKDKNITAISPRKYRAMCDNIVSFIKKKQKKRLGFPLKKFFLANRELVYDYKYKILLNQISYAKCFSGILRAVIRENGEIYPCETLMDKGLNYSFGNLRDVDMDFMKIWSSDKRRAVLKTIKDMRCVCGHGCDVSINTFFNPSNWIKLARKTLSY